MTTGVGRLVRAATTGRVVATAAVTVAVVVVTGRPAAGTPAATFVACCPGTTTVRVMIPPGAVTVTVVGPGDGRPFADGVRVGLAVGGFAAVFSTRCATGSRDCTESSPGHDNIGTTIATAATVPATAAADTQARRPGRIPLLGRV
ncbi:hypothetical protein AB0P21_40745 [Kribbella sp. NPDC056861]|uniref:hypothetical protein n=1 Tax=Kribbella sp. NPDC056861 TaxID=3154857 RepID=UPI00343076F9